MAHNPLIDRGLLVVVLDRLHHFPAAAILGPRQIGKTTLARMVAERVGRPVLWLDLERPSDRALLTDPYAYLPQHADKLVVIDEVQRMPEVFQALRVLIDERRRPGRFLLLGSSSPEIVRRAAESLAGRIAYMDLYPLNMLEVGMDHAHDLWLRGGYPDAFLAPSNGQAAHVQLAILRSLVERDLPQLGLPAAPEVTFTLRRGAVGHPWVSLSFLGCRAWERGTSSVLEHGEVRPDRVRLKDHRHTAIGRLNLRHFPSADLQRAR
jgi:predicted AAA+ superfamily ATPase